MKNQTWLSLLVVAVIFALSGTMRAKEKPESEFVPVVDVSLGTGSHMFMAGTTRVFNYEPGTGRRFPDGVTNVVFTDAFIGSTNVVFATNYSGTITIDGKSYSIGHIKSALQKIPQ